MKLSDALQAGATLLRTPGPTWETDCWAAAATGIAGRLVTADEIADLYWNNEWGITPGSDYEMWLRGVVRESYRWGQVIKKLRAHNA